MQKVLKHIGTGKTEIEIKSFINTAQYIKNELEKWLQTDLLSFEETDIELIEKQKKIKDDLKWDKEKLNQAVNTLNINIFDLEEESRIIKWIFDIYWTMYSQLGFDSIFWNKQKTKNYANILKNITLSRVASPKSKRASVEMLDSDYGININLDDVYNMMQALDDDKIDQIQDISFNYTKTVLNEKINVLFMDWTTLYFESQDEDELRQKWYSKDWKFSETQICLTILVTEAWLPVWYKVFSGSNYEWNTLQILLEEIEKKYKINKVILVADSWFLNEANTKYLEERWNKYILWARIKNLWDKIKNEITDKSKYIITLKDDKWNMAEWFREIEYKGKRLIINYSSKRAKKDEKDREKNIEKLIRKQWKDISELVSNFWYKKFLKQDWDAKIEIDKEKIEQAKLWDWLHWIITNDKEMREIELWLYYRWLWQVEESFRINKHDLLIRPIFHWNEKKIKAHIAIAFMAFSLVRHLEYKLNLHWYNYSPEITRRELLRVQWSVILDKTNPKQKFFLPSNISEIWKNIYRVLWKRWIRTVQEIV